MFVKHHKKNYQIFLFIVVICYGFILAPGCVHLHNQSNAKLANNSLTIFENGSKDSTNIFTSMKDNQDKTEKNVLKLNDNLASTKLKAFSTQLHSTYWAKKDDKDKSHTFIMEKLQAELDNRSKKRKPIVGEISKLQKAKDPAKNSASDAADWLKAVSGFLPKAIEDENKWFARQKLLLETIKFVSDIASSENELLDENRLKDLKTKILEKEIETKILNDKGEIVSNPTSRDLQDILKDDLKDIFKDDLENSDRIRFNIDGLLKKYTVDLFDPNAAPGLKVLLLSTAVDLAKIQLRKAKLETWYLNSKLEHLNRLTEVLNYEDLINEAKQTIEDRLNNGDLKYDETVITSINRLRSEKKDKAIKDAFQAMVTYAIVKTIDQSTIENIMQQPFVVDHEHSIRLSAIHADEHATIIRSGLKGLVAYHEGGVKPDTIANILRAAEAISLTILAADID